MNLFSVIATAVAGWFLFGRTRLNFHRGNNPQNRLPMTDHSNEPEYLQIFIKSVICPVCGSSFHIGFQAFYGDNETWLGGLFSLYPVDEKKKLIYFSNWIKKDRALLPKGSHLDNCPECGHPYPLEDEMFEKTHDISVRLFLQEFTMILPDGKRISFAEASSPSGGTETGI